MKVKSGFVCKVLLGVVLVIFVCWLSGCCRSPQPGETTAEGRRRHIRNLSINQQELTQDVDRALLYDEPSKLTDKKLP